MSKLEYRNFTKIYQWEEHDDMLDLLFLPVLLQLMHLDFVKYTHDMGLPVPTITRGIDDRIPGISTSDTHMGRALDYSSKGWHAVQIAKAVEYFCEKYKKVGAISSRTNTPEALVHHYGTGPHFHLQIRRNIKDFHINIQGVRYHGRKKESN